ncbi:NAD(P)H-dependent glycerol-3-phosphate dehydrogenase [Thioclava sp. FR2]|uniref:NAD(P)H-dependent glycerol-3-phosphate dehydrogenase n=1 Tax=Thioclava sp. FR2 TaxID=3445780 RepID=UPI003EBC32BA
MSITVLGAGAFGTALAVSIGKERSVTLWARDAGSLAENRESARLPGIELPENTRVVADLDTALNADTVLFAMPMQSLSQFLRSISVSLVDKSLVACCKGLDLTSLQGPATLLAERCPDSKAAILTGPSFATDIAKGLPTALTLACSNEEAALKLQKSLSTTNLRLYRTTDFVGAELGGALKNVIAIAAGIVMGAGLGDSARAAVMTRGFAELSRFATVRGARPDTLMGLSGFGDLVLTCTSDQSRNFRHGFALGKGQATDTNVTVEGVATALAVLNHVRNTEIESLLPITTMVAGVTQGQISVANAIHALMSRPLKEE